MLRAMAAAALGGYVLCGLNTTRRGDGLLSDLRRSDCQLLLVDADHRDLLDRVWTSTVSKFSMSHHRAIGMVSPQPRPLVPHREVGPTIR